MRKLVIGIVAATMTIAACGGSNKAKSTDTGAGGTTTTGSGGGSAVTTSGGGGGNDISKLAGDYAKAKIKITYASSSSSGENITIAQDGNGKSSFGTGSGTFYSDGKSSIACEGTGSSAHCTDLGSAGALGAGNIGGTFTATFAALAKVLSSQNGGDKSSETIAGRDATCVKWKASDIVGKLATLPLFADSAKPGEYDPNDSLTICVDKQSGFLLKIAGTKKGAVQDTLTATAVSEPTDADFTPPVTPATIPSVPTVPAG
jgi:hypothetical protein